MEIRCTVLLRACVRLATSTRDQLAAVLTTPPCTAAPRTTTHPSVPAVDTATRPITLPRLWTRTATISRRKRTTRTKTTSDLIHYQSITTQYHLSSILPTSSEDRLINCFIIYGKDAGLESKGPFFWLVSFLGIALRGGTAFELFQDLAGIQLVTGPCICATQVILV